VFELNKIYNLDTLEGLKKMPEKSVDLVFFDPPYNVNKDYGVYKDNLPQDSYEKFMKEILEESKRISKRGVCVYIDWKHFALFWQKLLPEAEPIIIYKRSSGFIFSKLKIMQHHHIILTTAKALIPVKSVWDDIRVYGEGYLFKEETFGHPAQTSLKATKRVIETFSMKGEIILDPFMGVGTTAVASKQLDRNFLGFEINPEYIEIANKRLAQKLIIDNFEK